MKALSIRQPWAWLILNAGKDVENRNWFTKFRGRVLLHASKTMTRDDYESAVDCALAIGAIGRARTPLSWAAGSNEFNPASIELGGIIGSVEIVDCVQESSSPWFFGKFGFILRNPKPLPFRPFKGSLGFFEVPDSFGRAA